MIQNAAQSGRVGAVTVRPSRTARWFGSAVCIAGGIWLLWISIGAVSAGGVAMLFMPLLGLAFIAAGLIVWGLYIQVEGSQVIVGSILIRRRYDRQQIAAIRISHSPANNWTFFQRADGSQVFSTSGYIWGTRTLNSLAQYLNVPLIS